MPVFPAALSQRFVGANAVGVTFFLAAGFALANPASTTELPQDAPTDTSALDTAEPLEDIAAAPTAPPEPTEIDLLVRIAAGFELDYTENRRIAVERDWFVRHPDYLTRVFTRARRYLPYIVAELERRDLPLDLALLPIVESAYDPFAYSHGRAAGLWQMIPGTARRFGVRQNWWYDGRRDVVDSTRAALDYLEHLVELNEGDWLNAIASYNSGEGNVRRAVRRNRAAGKPDDFWHLKLPKETRSYVPRLLALVDIVGNPSRFGVSLPAVLDEPQFLVTDIGSQLDLALAAELAGIDVDTVYAFNSGYNRWATDPAGPHRLVLPVAAAETFAAALAAVPVAERVRWKRHRIKSGDTLSGIAQRYHTTISSIRTANNLRGSTIRAGHHLMIPVATKPLSAYSQSADARLAKTLSRERPGVRIEHVVAAGESLWTISRRYGISTRQLASWNGMAPRDTLSVGRKLVVWTKAEAAPRLSPTAALGNTTRKLRYTVRAGDSLYLIARKFRITIADLVRWNNIDRDQILRPGQRLTMYVDVTRQSG